VPIARFGAGIFLACTRVGPHDKPRVPGNPAAILASSMSLASAANQTVMVLFLTYFILAAGDLFRRRLMQVMEPSLSARNVPPKSWATRAPLCKPKP